MHDLDRDGAVQVRTQTAVDDAHGAFGHPFDDLVTAIEDLPTEIARHRGSRILRSAVSSILDGERSQWGDPRWPLRGRRTDGRRRHGRRLPRSAYEPEPRRRDQDHACRATRSDGRAG